MRNRLDVSDFIAGLLVAGAVTIYAAGVAGSDLGGTRARASAVFLLGALACGVGARRDAFEGEDAGSRAIAALNATGVVTLIIGSRRLPLLDRPTLESSSRGEATMSAHASGLMTDEYPPFRLDMGGSDFGEGDV